MAAAGEVGELIENVDLPDDWEKLDVRSSEWIAWKRLGSESHNATGVPRTKVYVSISPLQLPLVVAQLLSSVFTIPQICEAKIASSPLSLHRPDAFVLYCQSLGELHSIANSLRSLCSGLHPSKMGFAPRFEQSDNLFWGFDPLSPELLVFGDSWRRAVCNRTAQIASRFCSEGKLSSDLVAECTLLRLAVDGIDPDTWNPPQSVL